MNLTHPAKDRRARLLAGLAAVLLLLVFVFPRQPIPTTGAAPAMNAAPQDIAFVYTIDRTCVPPLYYRDLTLMIHVGDAQSVRATTDGQEIAVQHDRAAGEVMLTTGADRFTLAISQATPADSLGQYRKAALKGNKGWAWSHGFDDNTGFTKHGTAAFDQYGWRATVFLIGSVIDDTRDEDWVLDRPGIVRLARAGWGIGNHGWVHENVSDLGDAGARENVLKLDAYLRGVIAEAGLPDTRLAAFAAPNFDVEYQPIFQELRRSTRLLFNESGSDGLIQVDPGLKAAAAQATAFQSLAPVGRDYRIETFGSGDEPSSALRAEIETMAATLDENHHFWLNTFTHDVDTKYPNTGIFAFLPWLHDTYGPGGNDSVWVAPSEEIYSYLLVRNRSEVRYERLSAGMEEPRYPAPTARPGPGSKGWPWGQFMKINYIPFLFMCPPEG